MKRHQQILAGILIFQIVLGVITFWPRSAATRAAQPVFPDLEAADIVALTITDDQGARIALRKSGDEWVMAEAGDYPAQASRITPILDKLTQLDTASLVARTEASQKALQVAGDDYVRRLDIELAGGKKHTLYLGTAPRYTATHFRVAGHTETYLTTALSTWELNTASSGWIDTTYVTVDAATLTEIVLENANGVFTLVKDTDTWTLADLAEDEVIAAGKANDVVSKVTRVTIQRPLGVTEDPTYGFSAPQATVTLKTVEGGVSTLRVGAKLADGSGYIVKSSESPYYVVVAEFNVKPLIENDRAAFLEELTAAPEP